MTIGQAGLAGRIESDDDQRRRLPAGTDVLALTATTAMVDLPFYIAVIA